MSCFVQTGNAVSDRNAAILRDSLNRLDKGELRRLWHWQSRAGNDNPERIAAARRNRRGRGIAG